MSHLIGRHGHARVGILTVIDEEFNALQATFGAFTEIGNSTAFSIETALVDVDGHKSFPFVLMMCDDRTNGPANTSVKSMVELFRPEYLVLVGIAGGILRGSLGAIEGPAPGDVLVGSYIHYAAYTKNVPGGRKQRYYSITQPSIHLVKQATAIKHTRSDEWWSSVVATSPIENHIPKVHVGEIISVEAVAGNPSAEDQRAFVEYFDHADGVDMESNGVARALSELSTDVHYAPQWIAVRGISDSVPEKPELAPNDNNEVRAEWKTYASSAAGAFARRLVERLLRDPRASADGDPGAAAWLFPPKKGMSVAPAIVLEEGKP